MDAPTPQSSTPQHGRSRSPSAVFKKRGSLPTEFEDADHTPAAVYQFHGYSAKENLGVWKRQQAWFDTFSLTPEQWNSPAGPLRPPHAMAAVLRSALGSVAGEDWRFRRAIGLDSFSTTGILYPEVFHMHLDSSAGKQGAEGEGEEAGGKDGDGSGGRGGGDKTGTSKGQQLKELLSCRKPYLGPYDFEIERHEAEQREKAKGKEGDGDGDRDRERDKMMQSNSLLQAGRLRFPVSSSCVCGCGGLCFCGEGPGDQMLRDTAAAGKVRLFRLSEGESAWDRLQANQSFDAFKRQAALRLPLHDKRSHDWTLHVHMAAGEMERIGQRQVKWEDIKAHLEAFLCVGIKLSSEPFGEQEEAPGSHGKKGGRRKAGGKGGKSGRRPARQEPIAAEPFLIPPTRILSMRQKRLTEGVLGSPTITTHGQFPRQFACEVIPDLLGRSFPAPSGPWLHQMLAPALTRILITSHALSFTLKRAPLYPSTCQMLKRQAGTSRDPADTDDKDRGPDTDRPMSAYSRHLASKISPYNPPPQELSDPQDRISQSRWYLTPEDIELVSQELGAKDGAGPSRPSSKQQGGVSRIVYERARGEKWSRSSSVCSNKEMPRHKGGRPRVPGWERESQVAPPPRMTNRWGQFRWLCWVAQLEPQIVARRILKLVTRAILISWGLADCSLAPCLMNTKDLSLLSGRNVRTRRRHSAFPTAVQSPALTRDTSADKDKDKDKMKPRGVGGVTGLSRPTDRDPASPRERVVSPSPGKKVGISDPGGGGGTRGRSRLGSARRKGKQRGDGSEGREKDPSAEALASSLAEETDRRPWLLCPVCLRKLFHVCKMDLVDRYCRLNALLPRWFPDELRWIHARLIQMGAPLHVSITHLNPIVKGRLLLGTTSQGNVFLPLKGACIDLESFSEEGPQHPLTTKYAPPPEDPLRLLQPKEEQDNRGQPPGGRTFNLWAGG
uniref:Uncharacterized protein n=1 Tax=Chromera velia CCMP2878 TaxID=1169474 RepID=A0A0G4FRC5_9ALVE|eukprot:Cvel_3647.t1-p1 / transcript=Cvel_3647.t1 / gene=Cvel_3647 / organism=Chromera_velia_CCMP2878 / gene_product=hypothetical protein / transcript_product=hypothetical protein / location=Cvel_scaffold151:487-8474(+) / protein_length=949 / sequence_SO=supercontig / SO=protein_coding / is_pseudo=false